MFFTELPLFNTPIYDRHCLFQFVMWDGQCAVLHIYLYAQPADGLRRGLRLFHRLWKAQLLKELADELILSSCLGVVVCYNDVVIKIHAYNRVCHMLHVAATGPRSEGHGHFEVECNVPLEGQPWPVQGASFEIFVGTRNIDRKEVGCSAYVLYPPNQRIHRGEAVGLGHPHDSVFSNVRVHRGCARVG